MLSRPKETYFLISIFWFTLIRYKKGLFLIEPPSFWGFVHPDFSWILVLNCKQRKWSFIKDNVKLFFQPRFSTQLYTRFILKSGIRRILKNRTKKEVFIKLGINQYLIKIKLTQSRNRQCIILNNIKYVLLIDKITDVFRVEWVVFFLLEYFILDPLGLVKIS